MAWFDRIPIGLVLIAALTVGLAPFTPPHLFTKLGMLVDGQLTQAVDIFDLLMHGTPWLLLAAKAGRALHLHRADGRTDDTEQARE
jgi:hypothetical protein